MEKRFVKKKQSNSEINDLPDQLLCHILSFLPTRDSVRSSLLSKRWRNLWLQVPVFDLDSLQFDGDVFGFIEFVDRFLESDKNLALNRFKLIYHYEDIEDHVLEIDAPRLERMSLCDHLSQDGYTSLDQDDDDSNSKRTMIRNFLTGISTVCFMEISSDTVEEFEFGKEEWPIKLSCVPPCFVSSLKYVALSTPVTTRTSSLMKLAIYFLRNCAALKKLTLSEDFGDDIIKKIKKIPRRSRRCSIVTGWLEPQLIYRRQDVE
ncbi:F-box/FBD/LRR-repeat protein At1g80470-like [Brassica rapa]|uniref:F-box/FBD/LRR-repeat protein At1g80470-like n=1 Tax=Brassica campestris TaxID=3711 RepID=UPI00142DE664|nr:F-box/FBD/LRR-repeat protein At1g80470-like [Brassica rapa]